MTEPSEVPDFRSQRMESAEGRGIARRAWAKWERLVLDAPLVRKVADPIVMPFASRYGAATAVDLLGFWLVWQLEGGFAGMERLGMGRTTIFRKIKRFRQLTGKHPDEFELVGVSLDVDSYWATVQAHMKDRERPKKK
jgi:hypothetical protein